MKITVNGQPTEITAGSLGKALVELGYGNDKVATAVNESFVPAASRAGTMLEAGDRIEIVAPRQGG